MASVTVDRRNGRIIVKVYNPARRKYERASLDPRAPLSEQEMAVRRLEALVARDVGLAAPETLDGIVEAYLEDLKLARRPEGTVKAYRCWYGHMSPRCGSKPAVSVKPVEFARHLYDCVEGIGHDGEPCQPISARTANYLRAVLSAAYRWAMENDLLATNPIERVKKLEEDPPKTPRALDEDELAALEPWLYGKPASWDDRCAREASRLALATGMRVGEICALRPIDIDRHMGRINVSSSVTEHGGLHIKGTKGRRARSVSVAADVLADLLDLQVASHSFPNHVNTVFCSESGALRRPSTISAAFRAACRDLGIGDIRFHALRHTHVTMLLETGADPKLVAERVGHADATLTLNTYAHVMPGRDRAAAEAVMDRIERGMRNGG